MGNGSKFLLFLGKEVTVLLGLLDSVQACDDDICYGFVHIAALNSLLEVTDWYFLLVNL